MFIFLNYTCDIFKYNVHFKLYDNLTCKDVKSVKYDN